MYIPALIPQLDAGVNMATNDYSISSTPSRPTPRMSVLASVKIPYLRRLDPVKGNGAHTHKTPLLTLKLSSHSFLDATLKDDLSSFPLYTIRTVGMTTTVIRADPWEDSTRAADIKWPKIVPLKGKGKNATDGVLIQLKGSRWKGGDGLLKPSTSKGGPRKFNIPHYSHSMKWQKHGTAYWCTTSPVKGPIAILDPSVDSLPARLTIYETLHDKYDTRPMLVHQGVSILLLDYLLVTAILLATDVQEWMVVQSPELNSSGTELNSNTALQWRKIVYGEPLFPKRSPAVTQHATPGDFDNLPSTPTSQEQMAKIIHGEPLYPRRQRPSSPQFSFTSESEDQEDDDDVQSLPGVPRTRSPSTSAESILYPLTNMSALSQSYTGSSFYPSQEMSSAPSSLSGPSRSTSPTFTTWSSQTVRVLPAIPLRLDPPRAQSTPPKPEYTSFSQEISSGTISPADASLWERPSVAVITRTQSVSRPLPRTPNTDVRSPIIRRTRSQTGQGGVEKPWLSTHPPPLPTPPITPSTPRTPGLLGRSLPPTPLDIAMGRAIGGGHMARANGDQPVRKPFEGEEEPRWMHVPTGEQVAPAPARPRPSFDQPPPAYNSIDFQTASS